MFSTGVTISKPSSEPSRGFLWLNGLESYLHDWRENAREAARLDCYCGQAVVVLFYLSYVILGPGKRAESLVLHSWHAYEVFESAYPSGWVRVLPASGNAKSANSAAKVELRMQEC